MPAETFSTAKAIKNETEHKVTELIMHYGGLSNSLSTNNKTLGGISMTRFDAVYGEGSTSVVLNPNDGGQNRFEFVFSSVDEATRFYAKYEGRRRRRQLEYGDIHYFVNKQWKNSNNGNVHVLYVEGENTATADMVSDSTLPHLSLAKDLGATAWSLEHRFRGKSQPYKRTFAANYADSLSTGHAIEDLAAFVKGQNKDSGESNPKWILVGKNYGDVLALWFRQKYPS
ncbi:serine carboxypeptidase s28 domain-containing protein [Ditylenchus destructor]|nr:serine carboxypeptidase s28 domain-containing protein [Ditylenchus destructor]